MPSRAGFRMSASGMAVYVAVGFVILGAGLWLAMDLAASRASILEERSVLALQTSRFMSQVFGTTITSTEYVLRDITTKVTAAELNAARSDRQVQERLSALAREKLATLPGVDGFGLLDERCIFTAAAEDRVIGIQSNSKLRTGQAQGLADRAYVEYVPAAKSANKQAAILVSRPMLSPDGRFLGGALAAIMLTRTQAWMEAFPIGEHDTLAMVDGEGILLAINPARPDRIGKPLRYPAAQPRLGESGGSASFSAVSPVDGRERIYGLSKVEGIPLNIIVGFDKAWTLREWRHRAWQLSAGFASLLLLLGLVVRKHLEALAQRDEMRALAITDPLTGVANRRQLALCGALEVKKAVRHKRPVSVLMVDIDRFKSINDAWGHPTGDRVIQSLARAMVANVRDTDVVGRLGGEEFAVILPDSEPGGACTLAERLREHVERGAAVLSEDGSRVDFTVSIGVAGLEEGTSTFEGLLGRADKAMYEAKSRGRNRVVRA